MSDCYIEYFDYYMPKEFVPVKDLLEIVENDENNKNYILKYSHLRDIAVETKRNQLTMFDELMGNYLQQNSSEDILYLFFSGKDYYVNHGMSAPYYLVERFNLKNATVVSLNQGCATTLQAIEMSHHIVKANPKAKVMIAAINKVLNDQERYLWPTLAGDGAAIMVLGSEGNIKVCGCHSYSDGSLSFERYQHLGLDYKEDYMAREKMIMRYLKNTLNTLVEKNHLSLSDISLLIPQNINYLVYRMHAKNLKIPVCKLYLDNIPHGGHLGDVDSIRNLYDAIGSDRVKKGDPFILFSLGEMGDNFNYVSTLLQRLS